MSHKQAHISAKLGWIWDINVSMDLGEHAGPLSANKVAQTPKLACIHGIFLHAKACILAKFGGIRDIKVFMESGEIRGHTWAHSVTNAHKLACMLTIFFHVRINISVILCQISKIKVSMKSWDYFPHVWTNSRPCEGKRGPKSRLRPPMRAKGPKTALHRSKKEGCLGTPIF